MARGAARGAAVSAMMAEAGHSGQVITFYSYKGGTGRSMALANVACLLARRAVVENARPVLAVDWDLEAPGLHRYFEPLLRRRDPSEPGLIELLYDVRKKLPPTVGDTERDALAKSLVEEIDLERYVEQTNFPKLSFLRAGSFSDEQYGTRASTFPWEPFYDTVPAFFRLFAQRLARDYSFVLIDSRTGITDIGGICTRLMPEKLVVVFTPNRQSLTGVTELVKRADAYRRSSRDPRPLTAFPLPSRIDTSFPDLMKLWRMGGGTVPGWQKEFVRVLREVEELDEEDEGRLERYFDAVQIVHIAQHAFGEPIAVLDERASDKTTVTSSYAALRDYLLRGAPWMEEEATDATPTDWRRKLEALEERIGTGPGESAEKETASRPPDRTHAKRMVAALLTLLLAFAVWPLWEHWQEKREGSQVLAQLLRPDAQTLDPGTYSLLLGEALPALSGSERQLALKRLRDTLALVPRPVIKWTSGESRVRYAHFSKSGRRVLLHDGRTISIWNAREGTKISEWSRRLDSARFYGDDEESIILWGDGQLERWSVRRDVRLASADAPVTGTIAPRLSADGRWLVLVAPEDVTVVDVKNALDGGGMAGRSLPRGPVSDTGRETLRFLETGIIIGAERVLVIDPSNKRLLWVPATAPRTAHLSPDGFVLGVVSTDEILTVIDTPTLKTLWQKVDVRDFAWLRPATGVAAITGDGRLASFDFATGQEVAATGGLGAGTPEKIEAIGDGRLLVRSDQEVVILSNRLQGPLLRVNQAVAGVAYSNARDRIAVVGPQAITVYDINMPALPEGADALEAAVCHRVGRALTREEWAAYFPGRDYDPRCKDPRPDGFSATSTW